MKTVVIGASEKPDRYAYKAIQSLLNHGHEVEGVAVREGELNGVKFKTGNPPIEGVDTVTLYVNPERQKEYYDYILSLKPRRVIFNPGTENPEFASLLSKKGVETEIACTLVLLSTDQY